MPVGEATFMFCASILGCISVAYISLLFAPLIMVIVDAVMNVMAVIVAPMVAVAIDLYIMYIEVRYRRWIIIQRCAVGRYSPYAHVKEFEIFDQVFTFAKFKSKQDAMLFTLENGI